MSAGLCPECAQGKTINCTLEYLDADDALATCATQLRPSEDVPPGRTRGDWMLTHSGRQFWPTAPAIDDLDIEDIAHSLGMLCRYNGHTRRFYSVAEHSVLISQAVPPSAALWGLLHDAAEAYVGDMVRPLKRQLPQFSAIEDQILLLLAVKHDLPWPMPEVVHEADNRILLTERTALLNLNGHRWHESVEALQPLPVEVTGWHPHHAKDRFLQRYEELTQ